MILFFNTSLVNVSVRSVQPGRGSANPQLVRHKSSGLVKGTRQRKWETLVCLYSSDRTATCCQHPCTWLIQVKVVGNELMKWSYWLCLLRSLSKHFRQVALFCHLAPIAVTKEEVRAWDKGAEMSPTLINPGWWGATFVCYLNELSKGECASPFKASLSGTVTSDD